MNLEIWLQGEPGVLRKAEFEYYFRTYYCLLEERDPQREHYDTIERAGLGRGSTMQKAFEDAIFWLHQKQVTPHTRDERKEP